MPGMTSEECQEWERKCREAVEPHLGGEKTEAVGPFTRKVWWDWDEGEIGAFFAAAWDGWKVAHGGRLPRNFLLAVTRDKVHVFDYSGGPVNPVVGEEVAVFDRENIGFLGEEGEKGSDEVTLRLTRSSQTEHVSIDARKLDQYDPLAAEVIAALSE